MVGDSVTLVDISLATHLSIAFEYRCIYLEKC